MQTDNRILDDVSKVATAAMGAFSGVRAEVEARLKDQVERWLADMNLVRREEFEAAMALATNARAGQEALEERVAALEARLAALEAATRR